MLKIGLRSVLSHRLRFALSTVAVLLGIAFVAGSFIVTDTLAATLRRTITQTAADLTVTSSSALDGASNLGTTDARPVTVSNDLANQIANLPGVAVADGQLLVGGTHLLGRDGKPLESYGLPTFGASWPHDASTATFTVTDGDAPWGPQQVAVDGGTARRAGIRVGDRVRVVTPNRTVSVQVTAIVTPVMSGLAAGAPLIAFDAVTAQHLLGSQAGWTSIAVTVKPGTDPATVRAAIAKLAGPDVKILTGAELTKAAGTAVDEAFGNTSGLLLMFAGLALFISTFLIVNTFAMQVTQRTRELAMLRAIGAGRGQVTWSVLLEATVIGLVGSTLGLLVGIGISAGLRQLFGSIDLGVPTAGLQLRTRTIVVCYVVGVAVTLVSAYFPARRAGSLPPVAALRQDASAPERTARFRLGCGGLLVLTGVAGFAAALAASGLPGVALILLAAFCGLIGLVLLGPLLARFATRVLTLPFGDSATSRLGRRNAERNPRRTSATAAALMISLALVSGLGTVVSSIKASIDRSVADTIGTADLVVSTSDGRPFPAAVADAVESVDGVASVGRVRSMSGQVADHQLRVLGVDPAVLDGPIVARVRSGSLAGLGGTQAAIPDNLARLLDAKVGSRLVLVTASGTYRLTVGAVLESNRQLDAVITSLGTFQQVGGAATDSALYVDLKPGVTPANVQPRLAKALTDYPVVDVRDQHAYAASQRAPYTSLLTVIYVLIAMAVLIAVLGIVNTLALSVVERTREIGLLRAIGLDRRQLGRMIRVESVAIALLGAFLGVLCGVAFGVGIQVVMANDGISVLDVPWLQLGGSVLAAALVGVLSALGPARRAAKLDLLGAIGVE